VRYQIVCSPRCFGKTGWLRKHVEAAMSSRTL
jgi:hypothetical protein